MLEKTFYTIDAQKCSSSCAAMHVMSWRADRDEQREQGKGEESLGGKTHQRKDAVFMKSNAGGASKQPPVARQASHWMPLWHGGGLTLEANS